MGLAAVTLTLSFEDPGVPKALLGGRFSIEGDSVRMKVQRSGRGIAFTHLAAMSFMLKSLMSLIRMISMSR